MMSGKLFSFSDVSVKDGVMTAQISINKNNSVFDGHFPDRPILPGVSYLEAIKELLCFFFKKRFNISALGSIKYLLPLDPDDCHIINTKIDITEQGSGISINGIFTSEQKVISKFRGLVAEKN